MRRLFGALLALVLVLAPAGPAAADPPLWRVRNQGVEVVMFGSVHVLTADVVWRSAELEAALAQADEVWFEVPVTPQARAQGVAAALRRGRLPRSQRLNDLLPREARPLLARTAARLGLSVTELQGLRPWFAEALISMADLQRRGARQADGVEEQLSARAPSTARRRAFETPAQQIAILANQPVRSQVASLVQTMKELEEKPQSFEELQVAWAAGDTAWIEREALDPMRRDTPNLYEKLVVDRNRRWAASIERMLVGRGRIVVIVGVGHLVGTESVPAMLRRRGYAVEGP
jgi:uncharacterized protein YbaP (TraB family)